MGTASPFIDITELENLIRSRLAAGYTLTADSVVKIQPPINTRNRNTKTNKLLWVRTKALSHLDEIMVAPA